ncbi:MULTISPECIES: DUF6578 domain-containing protein [Streptomyces]|uniref:DUF6578 domain-containing protein n=1 Tax=Streptomyces TaxID=1883 RepID=UPI0029CC0FBA|nr:hypothetical protein [Streptomyces sp. F8]MDX6764821.1 hypothetical protein [Streptomyces sp. F8]
MLTVNEVHCRLTVTAGSVERMHRPVPGSTVLVAAEKADGRAKERPGVRFSGCLVTARRVADPP